MDEFYPVLELRDIFTEDSDSSPNTETPQFWVHY